MPLISGMSRKNPVTLLPGRARLATHPLATGSDSRSTPTIGIYWDPTWQIRSEIQRALSANVMLESSELITVGERVGSQVDEEIDTVRRVEARDKYNRGGDM